uniref:Rna-directed dna polymerase from mobile element jockey-like protein n=1 Tax=Triatoma infestans TaxID=30076 RepID=A0A161MH98_TRIIF
MYFIRCMNTRRWLYLTNFLMKFLL